MGVLGGAFNPPHIGHLVLAQEAAAQLGLDEVLLVPAGQPPHRQIDPEPGPAVRLEMTRLAVRGDDLLEASGLEVEASGTSYSVRTLETLSERRPDAELHFLMGADVAAQLESWHRPERVLELARIAIAARPGTATDEAHAALERLGGAERAEVVRMPKLDVSSSDLRHRIRERRPVRYLLPDSVGELIRERGLYREAVTA